MSKSSKEPIENAQQIIEKFGGIRPMSSKINVAVTTIQGWKKRGVIPAARKDAIIKAAVEHEIDISDYIKDAKAVQVEEAPSQDNAPKAAEPPKVFETKTSGAKDVTSDVSDREDSTADTGKETAIKKDVEVEDWDDNVDGIPSHVKELPKDPENTIAYTEVAVNSDRKRLGRGAWASAAVILVILGLITVMIWPDVMGLKQRGENFAAMEGAPEEAGGFKGLVPENWSAQLEDLKKQAENAQKSLGDAVDSVQSASADLMKGQNIEQRVQQLQGYVSEITGEEAVYGLMDRFNAMRKTYVGQEALNDSISELASVLSQSEGQDEGQINSLLESARASNDALQASLGGVPQQELKAAAMLMTMTQLRASLGRSNDSFDEDLQILMNMVDPNDKELIAALEKLTPHAEQGILSANGLKSEFQTVAGDVVAASLRGEDVSVSEKMAAKMNDILKVEKDGELVSGTETQAKVERAEKLMEAGQWKKATEYLEGALDARELEPLRPWIRKVEGALDAARVRRALDDAIELNFGPGLLGGSKLLNGGQ